MKGRVEGGGEYSARARAICKSKADFPSEIRARGYGWARLNEHDDDKLFWPYKCDHCPKWHLTSKSISGVAAITRRKMIDLGSH